MAPWARVSGSSTPVTSTLASGIASRNSAMNGIDPPTPMSTGSVPPQASVKASRAASYAGPVTSSAIGSPVSTTSIVSWAPHGTCFSRCSLRQAMAFFEVSPGAVRSASRARAAGMRVLDEPSTLGASRPITESAGCVHSRSTFGPEPIHSTPGPTPDSARSRSSG